MSTEIIIGRSSASPIKVPDDRVAVSGKHVKITVSDNGDWKLEDLQSANGTFIRNESGEFDRVYKKDISEFDVIRMGNDGANSFVFTARRAMFPNDSYRKEFKHLKKVLDTCKAEEARKEKRIEINGWISKLSGAAVMIVCAILASIKGIDIDPNLRIGLVALAPIAVGFIFNGDKKSLKAIKKKKDKFMLCPNCGKRISEFDVEQGQCSKCKAK